MPLPALAQDDITGLDMYYGKEDLVVTPSRTPKRISQTAENVVVITAKELEEMNAHSLEEALNLATGVTMEYLFHNTGGAFIQGAPGPNVRMTIDGVTLNDLSTNLSSAGLIPVQFIERIEIIKGPASSSWGSSLGGVINIITKEPGTSAVKGLVSTSYGEGDRRDNRAEVSGRAGAFGYYIQGGNIAFDGFAPGEQSDHDVYYAKFTAAATNRLDLTLTTLYGNEQLGAGVDLLQDLRYDASLEALVSSLSAKYRVADASELSLSLKTKKIIQRFSEKQISTGTELSFLSEKDRTYGALLLLSSQMSVHDLALGAEFEREDLIEDTAVMLYSLSFSVDQKRRKQAVFGNDTITLGAFTVAPGLRYDRTSDNETFASPSLGITSRLSGDTLLRIYAAKGFRTPPFAYEYGEIIRRPNPDIRNEKIRSIQGGIETTSIPYLWFKASLFKHSLWDAFAEEGFSDGTFRTINAGQERLYGIEVEARTMPVYNTSLAGSITLMNAKDRQTGKNILYRPAATCNVELKYKNRRSFTALLAGHYVRWTSVPLQFLFENQPPQNFIWDLHASKTLWTGERTSADLFASVHNMFNGKQYFGNFVPESSTPYRWWEGGVRMRF
ncbi:MAG TPA: TonB-dependent receptor [Nitrospirota bacterium]|nr:TonB-dependent receptor [Nitrospirota bacterium]